jgi:NAD-dependent DNA ligase
VASSKEEKRAAELRDVLDYHLYRYHVLDDPEVAFTTSSSRSRKRTRDS